MSRPLVFGNRTLLRILVNVACSPSMPPAKEQTWLSAVGTNGRGLSNHEPDHCYCRMVIASIEVSTEPGWKSPLLGRYTTVMPDA